jgi:ElaB/YqjD/DUF883 family membrane-anchored ribosome-binding protein
MTDPSSDTLRHDSEEAFAQKTSMAQAANDLRAAASEKAREIMQTAEEKAADLKERAIHSAQQFRESTTDHANQLKASASEKAFALKNAANDRAQYLKESANEQWLDTRIKAKEFHITAEDYIRQNPTKCVLGALGAGFLIGLIVRR